MKTRNFFSIGIIAVFMLVGCNNGSIVDKSLVEKEGTPELFSYDYMDLLP